MPRRFVLLVTLKSYSQEDLTAEGQQMSQNIARSRAGRAALRIKTSYPGSTAWYGC